MDTYLVTLRPRGPCASAITSNTLFGAVCWALQTLRLVSVADLLADFASAPRFVFSSAFPFVEGPNGVVRSFPRPVIALPTTEQIYRLAEERAKTPDRSSLVFKRQVKDITGDAKQIKRTAYVSQTLFTEICAGQWDGLRLLRQWGNQISPVGDALWLKQDSQTIWRRTQKPAALWRTTDVQRNAIDRVAGATAEGLLFYETQTFFARGQAGLWFLARSDRQAWAWLAAAFRYLADTGIGGKRTVGKGHFEFAVEPAAGVLPEVADSDSFITLSRYLPARPAAPDQPEAEPRSYTLLPVYQRPDNKFPGADQMRAHSGRVHLYAEGSTFAVSGEKRLCYGRIAPLCQVDGRTIYYSGMTVPVFAKLGGVL